MKKNKARNTSKNWIIVVTVCAILFVLIQAYAFFQSTSSKKEDKQTKGSIVDQLEQIQQPMSAEKDKWKDVIPEDCMSFFDGCNTCRRIADGQTVCTRRKCEQYDEPKCLDQEQAEQEETNEPRQQENTKQEVKESTNEDTYKQEMTLGDGDERG